MWCVNVNNVSAEIILIDFAKREKCKIIANNNNKRANSKNKKKNNVINDGNVLHIIRICMNNDRSSEIRCVCDGNDL